MIERLDHPFLCRVTSDRVSFSQMIVALLDRDMRLYAVA
jgi:hypothetical protein